MNRTDVYIVYYFYFVQKNIDNNNAVKSTELNWTGREKKTSHQDRRTKRESESA